MLLVGLIDRPCPGLGVWYATAYPLRNRALPMSGTVIKRGCLGTLVTQEARHSLRYRSSTLRYRGASTATSRDCAVTAR